MRKRNPLMIVAGVLLALTLAAVPMPAGAQRAAASQVPLVEEVFTWHLSHARLVNPPQVGESPEGILVTDYTIEALATSEEDFAPATQGKFRMTGTLFSPKTDMPGQRAGYWYLSGTWSVTEDNPDPRAAKARYGPGVVKGKLTAEFAFNPLTDGGAVTAQVKLPVMPQGGRWGSGVGKLVGNELLEGDMTVSLSRRLANN